MKDISLEQVESIAAHCRQMRSEAIYVAFSSFFSSLGSGVAGFFSPQNKDYSPVADTRAYAGSKRSSLLTMNTGYSWRQVTAD